MRVFLSYSHADKSFAIKLRRRFEENGLSFNDPSESPAAGTSWRRQVEEAIRSSEAVLLLLSPRQKADESQQLTWMLALEAAWADSKPLIPILLRNAELPAFVRSGASGDSVQAIRIRRSEDLGPAVDAILRTLGIAPEKPRRRLGGSRYLNNISSGSRFSRIIESYPVVTDEDRAQWRERLSAIKQYAEQLKV
ncbi:MAG TPA: toll/interleukin-1 receptor domain-containing protein [Thermoanaerobaculia bacterium]